MSVLDYVGLPFPVNVFAALAGPRASGTYYGTSTGPGGEQISSYFPAGSTTSGQTSLESLTTSMLIGRPIVPSPPPTAPPATTTPVPTTVPASPPPAAPPLSTIQPGVGSSPPPVLVPVAPGDPLIAQVPYPLLTGPVVEEVVPFATRVAAAVGRYILPTAAVGPYAVETSQLGVRIPGRPTLADMARAEGELSRYDVDELTPVVIGPAETVTGITGPTARAILASIMRANASQASLQNRYGGGAGSATQELAAGRERIAAAAREVAATANPPPLQVPVVKSNALLTRLRAFATSPIFLGAAAGLLLPSVRRASAAPAAAAPSFTPGVEPITPIQIFPSFGSGGSFGTNTPQANYCEANRKRKAAKRRKCRQRANVAWTSGPKKGRLAGTKCLSYE